MNLDHNSCGKAVRADKGPHKSFSGKNEGKERRSVSPVQRFEDLVCTTGSPVLGSLASYLMGTGVRFATWLSCARAPVEDHCMLLWLKHLHFEHKKGVYT